MTTLSPSRLPRRSPSFAVVAVTFLAACGGGDSAGLHSPVPASLRLVSGDRQTGAAGSPLAQAIVVEVVDASGAPVAGSGVAFRHSRWGQRERDSGDVGRVWSDCDAVDGGPEGGRCAAVDGGHPVERVGAATDDHRVCGGRACRSARRRFADHGTRRDPASPDHRHTARPLRQSRSDGGSSNPAAPRISSNQSLAEQAVSQPISRARCSPDCRSPARPARRRSCWTPMA